MIFYVFVLQCKKGNTLHQEKTNEKACDRITT